MLQCTRLTCWASSPFNQFWVRSEVKTTEANVTYGDFLHRPLVWKAKRCQILKKPLYHQLHKLFPPVHTLLHRLRYTISREIFLYQQQWFVVGIFQLGIFKQKWQDYEAATGLDQKNQLVRLATFRSVVGKECLQIFGILVWLR